MGGWGGGVLRQYDPSSQSKRQGLCTVASSLAEFDKDICGQPTNLFCSCSDKHQHLLQIKSNSCKTCSSKHQKSQH